MEPLIKFIQRTPAPVRWGLWLPTSVATFLIVHVGVMLGGKLMVFMSKGGWGDNFVEYLLAPGLAGYLAITFPMTFVPSPRRATALVLALLWMAVLGGLVGLGAFTGDGKSVVPAIVSAVACAIGYFDYMPPRTSTFQPMVESVEHTS